jgi:hypothetical protein
MCWVRHLSAVVTLLVTAPAWGQAVPSKEPTSTHIFPAGGRIGTVVPVRVGGECLPPGANFHIIGEGLKAPDKLGPRAKARYEPSPRRKPRDADGNPLVNYPKEWESKITIGLGAEIGPAQWRVTCGWGGTRPRPFIIGDLPEFIEQEPNSDPEHANRITLPVTVNGQIAGERDIDFFVFKAKKGDVVVCDVLAERIGSPLDPVVEVRDAKGRRVQLQEVRVGKDPVVAFKVTADGDYTLNIANVSFHGGPEYVYRMTLSTKPYVAFAFPPGEEGLKDHEVRLFALSGSDDFRSWKEKVPIPGPHRSWWGQSGGRAGIFLFQGSFGPEVVAAGNHSIAKAMTLMVPSWVSGRFLEAASEDWFQFTADKDEAFTLECWPFPVTSPVCPVVVLKSATGKELAKANGVDTENHRVRLEWKAPAAGKYRILVRDLQHGARGGANFIYRMHFNRAEPNYELNLLTDHVNVPQGGKAELDVVVERSGGFTGPLDLSVSGLPKGVSLESTRIPANQSRVKLVLAARDDAQPVHAVLRVYGKTVMSGVKRQVAAGVPRIGHSEDWMGQLKPSAIHLTIQHKPIFRLTCNEAYQYAHRGTIYPYKLQVERLNGFDGEITLQIADRQVQDLDGIEVKERIVPKGIKEMAALIYLPETMHANVQHHCRPYIQGHATFTDKWGQKHAMLALCDKRCMIRTLPPVVKLKAADKQLTVRSGEKIACKLVLERTSNFKGPMDVELIDPDSGFTADKIHIKAGETSATVTVLLGPKVAAGEGLALRFRAIGQMPGDVTVISETVVAVKVQ